MQYIPPQLKLLQLFQKGCDGDEHAGFQTQDYWKIPRDFKVLSQASVFTDQQVPIFFKYELIQKLYRHNPPLKSNILSVILNTKK
jgi:hypothetical protein